jgi:tetratricopeptide (TPR) repeat protein
MKRFLLFLILLVGFCAAIAQQTKIDSLRVYALQDSQDSTRINTYLEIASLYRRVNFDSMFYYGSLAHKLSIIHNDKRAEAESSILMGLSHIRRGNLTEGLKICQAALAISLSNNLKKSEADALNTIGLVYNYQGNYPVALDYYQRALTVGEPLKNSETIGSILNNIGGIYYNLKDYDLALTYWRRTLDLQQKLADNGAAGSSMNNIGLVYADKGDYKMSLTYYFQSLKMYEPNSCARIYPLENIGQNYLKLKKLDSAEVYLTQAHRGSEVCNNMVVQMGALTGLAETRKAASKYKEALQYLEKAYQIGKTAGLNRETAITAKSLADLYEQLGNTTQAFSMFKAYHVLQDSLYNNENAKAIGKLEAQYEFELDKKEQETTQRIENIEKERILTREKWIRNTFIGGFILMLFVAFMTYRNFQKKKVSNLRLQLLNKEINAQQSVLISQAKELQELNNSLNQLNRDLELKIAERTRELIDKNTELENKNAKLADYAFINAHKLRAPVATILGLVTLFENKQVENHERNEIVSKIRNCTEELNDIVREIRITLEKEKTQAQ